MTTLESKASNFSQVIDGDTYIVHFAVDGANNVQMYNNETDKTGKFTLTDFYQNWVDFKENTNYFVWTTEALNNHRTSDYFPHAKMWYNPEW